MSEERWTTDGKRCDGLAIVEGIDGLVIMPPPSERLPLDRCPCCDKPFQTMRAAQLVADMLYPTKKAAIDAD
jgi:hypothetical protein